MQIKEVKVCFTPNGKAYSFDCSDVFVKYGENVLVETIRGMEIGTICSKVSTKQESDFLEPLKKIIRLATKEEVEQKSLNKIKEEEIKNISEKFANKLNLEMKIVSAELNFDASKVVISFTADSRVDFRELVKLLASKYKMRIELRQLDVREETKVLGGLGPCGRECCCSKFLSEATHSSIKMAKVQGLSLNPTSVSGLCGKLKCCLAYENEYYSEINKIMPKLNTEVITPDGKGLVVYNNLLKQQVSVKFINPDGSQSIKDYPAKDLKLEKRSDI